MCFSIMGFALLFGGIIWQDILLAHAIYFSSARIVINNSGGYELINISHWYNYILFFVIVLFQISYLVFYVLKIPKMKSGILKKRDTAILTCCCAFFVLISLLSKKAVITAQYVFMLKIGLNDTSLPTWFSPILLTAAGALITIMTSVYLHMKSKRVIKLQFKNEDINRWF